MYSTKQEEKIRGGRGALKHGVISKPNRYSMIIESTF